MKKFLTILILFLININIVTANEKIEVTFNKCVDGDTAWFNLNNEVIKVRFLAIDTPESTTKKEIFGKEASNFTCNKLKTAKKLEIKYDKNSDKKDKYDRHLAWVFTDNKLLQDLIIKEGLAKVAYLYGDYEYTDTLKASEQLAKENKLNIWSDYEEPTLNYWLLGIALLIIILIFIFSKKERNKMIKKVKNSLKKELKKQMK